MTSLKTRLRSIKRRIAELKHRIRFGRPNPLFDAAWYLARYPDVEESGIPAFQHYVTNGAAEGRQPSPTFVTRWYVAKYPDVAKRGMEPLAHYWQIGAAEGYNPNPVFDTAWYLRRNPDVARSGINPLLHYLRNGWLEGRDPHPGFDLRGYLDQHPDVREAGIEPLGHYLMGVAEGRPRLRLSTQAVTSCAVRCLKRADVAASDSLCLFVAYAPGGRLRPHVPTYLAALLAAGLKIVLIAAVDDPAAEPEIPLLDRLAAVYVRDNKGFDFGAWAHILAIEPACYRARTLLFVNDSVFGPFRPDDMTAILSRIDESPADVVALTDNHERGWHLQSYFIAFKERALASFHLHRFLLSVQNLDTKQEVIDEYELALTPALVSAGLRCEALFPSAEADNLTLFHWRELIGRGFPFVKLAVFRDPLPGIDTTGWRETLAAEGYDVRLVESYLGTLSPETPDALDAGGESRPVPQAPPACPRRPLRMSFIGPWNYASGLGVASRGYVSALWRLPFEVNLHAIRKPFHTHARTTALTEVVSFSGAPDLTVVDLNPDAWPALLDPGHHEILSASARRVGLWIWEMSHVPENWYPVFLEQDAIWSMSRYCAEVFGRAGAKRVEVVPPAVEFDPAPHASLDASAARRQLDLPAEARLVLYAFDGASYLVRKNPAALVRAFKRSGLGSRGWVLVLKTKNLYDNVEEGSRLAALVAGDASIRLINRSLSRQDLSALFSAADVYASSHRSEGFGLTVAEAMAAGKIVVATDYGGTRDFLDSSCGFPVKARMAKLEADFGHYTSGGEWAEVDEDALASALSSAAAAAEDGGSEIGRRASQRIRERLSVEAVAERIRSSAEALVG